MSGIINKVKVTIIGPGVAKVHIDKKDLFGGYGVNQLYNLILRILCYRMLQETTMMPIQASMVSVG